MIGPMVLPAPTLHAERLVLRPFEDSDSDDLFSLLTDAHVFPCRFVSWWRPVRSCESP